MKIFLSWSGRRSLAIAAALNEFLSHAIQAVEPFYSPEILKGLKWANELDKALENTRFGIICLTPDNLTSPWLHYEAGALSKTRDSKIWTFLDGLTPEQVPAPLQRFQHTVAEENDVLRLLISINQTLAHTKNTSLTDQVLLTSFKLGWPKFFQKLEEAKKIIDSPDSDAFLGIQKVYLHLADEHNLPNWLKNAQSIQVLKTWFPETDEIRKGLQDAISLGATVKLLMCSPNSSLLKERSYNANNKKDWLGPVVVYQAVLDIHDLLSPSSTTVEFRFYDSWPGCPAIWYDDELLMGFYFRGKPSPENPWVRITKGSEFARILNRQFAELWDSTTEEERLTTAKEREVWLERNKKWDKR